MKKRVMFSMLTLALGMVACGDDDGAGTGDEGDGSASGAGTSGGAGKGSSGGAGTGSGSTGSGGAADDIAMCFMMASMPGGDCDISEYAACVQEACAAEYKTCLGENYESGDFSGGECESLGDCVAMADDPCTCMADMACITCFTNNFVTCSLNSGCTPPACAGGGGTAGTGGLDLSKTCADLEACCNAKSGADKDTCLMTYMQVMGIGDIACAGVYSTQSCE